MFAVVLALCILLHADPGSLRALAMGVVVWEIAWILVSLSGVLDRKGTNE